MSALAQAGGAMLILLGLVLFLLSTPITIEATDTGTGTPLENQSAYFKSIVAQYPLIIALVPFMFMFIGGAMILKDSD